MRQDHIVLVGSIKDGHMAFGPFPSAGHAKKWMHDNGILDTDKVHMRGTTLALQAPKLAKKAVLA